MNIEEPMIFCLKCNERIVFKPTLIDDYFNNLNVICPNCNSAINLWDTLKNTVRKNFMLYQAFSALGAQTKIIETVLKPNKIAHIRFSEFGISNEAKILYINYTSQGIGLFPVELHGNVPKRRIVGNEVTLYPVPNDNEPIETELSIMVTWIDLKSDQTEFSNITDAFEAFSNKMFSDSIIPANVAVESALSKLLSNIISKYVPKKRTEDFLTNSATYSNQLNVVLPILAGILELPKLPDEIRGLLNRLRSLRNQIAHSGTTEKPLYKDDTADLLCAAIFGLRYTTLIAKHLTSA